MLALLALAALGAQASDSAHAALRFEPRARADPRDVAGGPLDLVSVAFGQQDTWMLLRVRTAAPWDAAALDGAGRTICVVIHRPLGSARTRVCVGAGDDPVTYAPVDPLTGAAGAPRPVLAIVARPDAHTFQARFAPLEIDLPSGAYAWRIVSSWSDAAACATPCVDHAPDAGPVSDRRMLLAQPRCFGAASRARRPCHSPALRRVVMPTPKDSMVAGNAPCAPVSDPPPGIYQCAFGASAERASTTVALVGDSHAVAWRGAVELVAQHKRWRGLTMSRAGCPLTKAQIILPTPEASAECTAWNGRLQQWFAEHPEVSTVIVSVHPARFERATEAGYRAAWRALPRTVRRIYVIRDFPFVGMGATARCIERALERRRADVGERCAQSRRRVLRPDRMAAAARRDRSGRVRVIDLTRHMCDRRRCFPVVGGALVNKPTAHLTRIFSTSAGPFLLRAINRAG